MRPALIGCAALRSAMRHSVRRVLWPAWVRAAGSGARVPPPRGDMAEPGSGPSRAREEEPDPAGKEEAAPAAKKRRLAGGERYVPPPRKLNTGVSFGAEHFAETSYYFEGGLRKVRPYYFDFRTYCKGRWVGRSLLHVFGTEFRAQPLAYYRAAARAGRLRLNEEPVRDLDIVLKVGGPGWALPGAEPGLSQAVSITPWSQNTGPGVGLGNPDGFLSVRRILRFCGGAEGETGAPGEFLPRWIRGCVGATAPCVPYSFLGPWEREWAGYWNCVVHTLTILNPRCQEKGALILLPQCQVPVVCGQVGGRTGWIEADCPYPFQNNDFLRNTVHRHEPPVTAQPIRILAEDEEVVVVDKPSSLPVHPCGRFRHNTVIFILGKEHGLRELHTLHRLDRMTSGVLMFAKTAAVSKRIDEQVRQRQVRARSCCCAPGAARFGLWMSSSSPDNSLSHCYSYLLVLL